MTKESAAEKEWRESYFKASDGKRLFYRIYRPLQPRRSMIIFHGFGEHAHRYEKFSSYFPDFQIALYDMRGMGQSEGEPVFVDSYERYDRDALDFLDFLDSEYPVDAPRIFLGHSMGGLTLMRLWMIYHAQAERFVFSAPCFRVAVPHFALEMNRWIERFQPRFIYHNPVYYKNLSHCDFEMLSYKNDPWIMRKMTSRLLNEMVQAGKKITSLESLTFEKPVHFLLAGEDKLVRADEAQNVFNRITAPSKTLNIYKNFYHEIFNESDQVRVFQDLQNLLT